MSYNVVSFNSEGKQDITLQLPEDISIGQSISGDVLFTTLYEGLDWLVLSNPQVQAAPAGEEYGWADYRILGQHPVDGTNIFFYLTDITQGSGDMRMEIHGPNWEGRWYDQGKTSWQDEFHFSFQTRAMYRLDFDSRDWVSANDLSSNGSVSFADGAARFDSNGGYLESSFAVDLTGPFTVSMWAKIESSQSVNGNDYSAMFNWGSGSPNYLDFYALNNKVRLNYIDSSGGVDNRGTAALSAGWNHLVLVMNPDTNEKKVYLNGSEDSLSGPGFTGSFNASQTFRLGWNWGSANYNPDNHIDDVRIWQRALTSSEVSALNQAGQSEITTLDEKLMAYFRAEDAVNERGGDDATLSDVSVSNDGKYGKSWDFSGNQNAVATVPTINLATNDDKRYTASAWVYNINNGPNAGQATSFITDDSTGYMPFYLGYGFNGSKKLMAATNNGGVWQKAVDVNGGGDFILDGSQAPYLNAWTHILFTASGDEIRYYINGAHVATATNAALSGSFDITRIGNLTSGWFGKNTIGDKVDDVAFWDRILSDQEISSVYQNEVHAAYSGNQGGEHHDNGDPFHGISSIRDFVFANDSSSSDSAIYINREGGQTRISIASNLSDVPAVTLDLGIEEYSDKEIVSDGVLVFALEGELKFVSIDAGSSAASIVSSVSIPNISKVRIDKNFGGAGKKMVVFDKDGGAHTFTAASNGTSPTAVQALPINIPADTGLASGCQIFDSEIADGKFVVLARDPNGGSPQIVAYEEGSFNPVTLNNLPTADCWEINYIVNEIDGSAQWYIADANGNVHVTSNLNNWS